MGNACDDKTHAEIFSRLNEVTKGLAENTAYVKATIEQNNKLIALIKWALGFAFLVTMFSLGALVFSKTGKEGVDAAMNPVKAISAHTGQDELRNWVKANHLINLYG